MALGSFQIPLLAAGVIFAVGIVVALLWRRLHFRREVREAEAGLRLLSGLGWSELAQLVVQLLRVRGFELADTARKPGAGYDLAVQRGAERYLVQCRHGGAQHLGANAVRDLLAVVGDDRRGRGLGRRLRGRFDRGRGRLGGRGLHRGLDVDDQAGEVALALAPGAELAVVVAQLVEAALESRPCRGRIIRTFFGETFRAQAANARANEPVRQKAAFAQADQSTFGRRGHGQRFAGSTRHECDPFGNHGMNMDVVCW